MRAGSRVTWVAGTDMDILVVMVAKTQCFVERKLVKHKI